MGFHFRECFFRSGFGAGNALPESIPAGCSENAVSFLPGLPVWNTCENGEIGDAKVLKVGISAFAI